MCWECPDCGKTVAAGYRCFGGKYIGYHKPVNPYAAAIFDLGEPYVRHVSRRESDGKD